MSLKQLKNMRVKKIDLVPAGDNPPALAVMWKAAPMVDCPDCGKPMPAGGKCKACGYTAKAKPSAAPVFKADGNPPTCGEILDAREASDDLQKLNWAFQDSMYGILWSGSANKTALLKASVEEFGQRLKEITGELEGDATMKSAPGDETPEAFVERARVFGDAAISKAREKAMTKTKLDVSAIPEAQRSAVVELQKSATDTAAELVTAQAALATANAEIATLKAKVSKAATDDDEDDLADVPEPRRAKMLKERATFKATADEVAKLRDERDLEQRVEKVRTDHKDLAPGCTHKELGGLLHRIEKGKSTAADVTELERLIKSWTEQARAGKVTKEVITAADDQPGSSSGAPAELKKRAQGLVDAKAAPTLAKAMEQVLASDPELRARVSARDDEDDE